MFATYQISPVADIQMPSPTGTIVMLCSLEKTIRMKFNILFLLIIITLTCCKEEDSNSPSIEQVNEIGNKLAEWGNSNCKIIAINETEILWQGPNAGGCSEVYFEFTGTFDPFDFEEQEDIVQRNLRELIQSSVCELSNLITNIQSIESNTSEQQISQHLECLGTIEIVDGVFGNEFPLGRISECD